MFFPEPDIGLRELTTNNAGLCAAIDKIYSEFEFAPQRAQGLVPLVEVVSITPSETNFGTVFDSEFAIIDWQPRPRELTPPPPSKPPPTPTLPGLPAVRNDLDDDIPF